MDAAYGPSPHASRAPRRPGLPAPSGTPGRPGPLRVLRAPFQARTWREFLYLLLSLPLSIVMFTLALLTISLGAGLLITFLGIPVLALGLIGCRGLGALERARARALLDLDVPAPEPVRTARPGRFMTWIGGVLKSGASWRHFVYCLLHYPWATFAFTVALTFWTIGWSLLAYPLWHWAFPMYLGQDGIHLYGDGTHGIYLDTPFEIGVTSAVGALLVLAGPWVFHGLAQVDRLLVRGLLGPSPLAGRVTELESGRAAVSETAAADLRRIERNLHDGAQARLVSLAMDLGLAKEKLKEDPAAAARMVDEAHGEVKVVLRELRDLARGIHPAILTDRGLGPALSALAARCAVPVSVGVGMPRRPAVAIEGIAYFTVSELLQNISKHARATRASVDVWRTGDRLMVLVSDDGRGGARAEAGGGLAGLADRLGAVDGLLVIDSPAGGPTTVTAELPWRD